jgi:hypothetical protein
MDDRAINPDPPTPNMGYSCLAAALGVALATLVIVLGLSLYVLLVVG